MSDCKPRVLLVRQGSILPDPRIERTVLATKDSYDISILAFDEAQIGETNDALHGVELKRFHGIKSTSETPSKILRRINLILFFIYLQYYLLGKRFDIVHACDFITFFPCVFMSKLKSLILIYDIYDFYFDIIKNMPLPIRKFVRYLDLRFMCFADRIIIADDYRFEQINSELHSKVEVIYNSPPDIIPKLKKPSSTSHLINIIYLGSINFQKRDLRFFLDAILELKNNFVLNIYGSGKDLQRLKDEYGAATNIFINEPIPYFEAMAVTYQNDYVLAIYDPSVGNNVLASPNKVFEAFMLGKPVLINHELKISEAIVKDQLGYTFPFNSTPKVKSLLQNLPGPFTSKYNSISKAARATYKRKFSFEKLKDTMLSIYGDLSNKS